MLWAQSAHKQSEQDASAKPDGAKRLWMRVWSTNCDGAKQPRMWVWSVNPEGAKRPSSPAGLAWRGTKGLATLVVMKLTQAYVWTLHIRKSKQVKVHVHYLAVIQTKHPIVYLGTYYRCQQRRAKPGFNVINNYQTWIFIIMLVYIYIQFIVLKFIYILKSWSRTQNGVYK